MERCDDVMLNVNQKNYAEQNTVSAEAQLNVNDYVSIINRGGNKKVLFFGNSITRHAPKPDIGWWGDWGMAASCRDNDYVHRVVSFLDAEYGKVDYCIAQGSAWEGAYFTGEKILEEYYLSAREFCADIIIVRIGENIKRSDAERISCKPYFEIAIRFFAANPKAKVVITDNFWYSELFYNCAKEVAEENGYEFCAIGDLSKDEGNMAIGLFEHRGVAVHPNDHGMRRIAERIIEKLNTDYTKSRLK